MNKKRIIFFGSGDFPRNTFEWLVDKAWCVREYPLEVVGLVTSHDKCEDDGQTLREIADEYQIPTTIVKNCDNDELYEWCKNLQPDLFVVISFKKIPERLLNLVKNRAFNVHASLLPFLRGANPIRWAIRHNMTETGLTAIQLSDKIDCGNIIANKIIKISEDDNYGSLKSRMAEECRDFTEKIIEKYYINETTMPNIIQNNCGIINPLFYAPKLNINYHHIEPNEDLKTVLRSLAPYDGLRCRLVVTQKRPTTKLLIGWRYEPIETYDCTIWGVHKPEQGEKTLIEVFHRTYPPYIVDELQIQGKKRMTYNQFINGFKYLKNIKKDDGKYKVYIKLY